MNSPSAASSAWASRGPSSPSCSRTARSGSAITCSIRTCPTIRTSRARCSATSPRPCASVIRAQIPRHRLRREIIATATTNSLVNRMGPVFVARAQEDTDADPAAISRAYTIAREIFSMRSLWADIEVAGQRGGRRTCSTACSIAPAACCGTPATGCCANAARICTSKTPCANCAPASEQLTDGVDCGVGGEARAQHDATLAELTGGGVPEKLARRVARLALLEPALDIVALARDERRRRSPTSRACTSSSACRSGLDWLHGEIDRLAVDGPWQATRAHRPARRRHARASRAHPAGAAHARRDARSANAWRAGARSAPRRSPSWKRTLTEMRAVGTADFATLTVGVDAVRSLVERLDARCASRW